MSDVKSLAKKQDTPAMGASLVKDLLSKSFSKGGKLKAIKVKVKFGDGGKKDEDAPKKRKSVGPSGAY